MMDGNEAAASVAYRASEVIALYPITPASPMGELADEWAAQGRRNLFGGVPAVIEMQSEAGVAGAVHGALQGGALATSFTASQGLLLMIPNLYRIAGELTPFCLHVAARTVATHALSIFADHSDVMACRGTGFAFLAASSPQEAQDMACVAHAATLRSRIPFLHFFDGFRTSHEIASVTPLDDGEILEMLDPASIADHRRRALDPDRPVIRGTAQNPDAFFQAREAVEPFYRACPGVVEATLRRFGELTGREYRLFEYTGHPEAERVVVMIGSGAETARETVDWLVARGERVGVLQVRLYRPFSCRHFLEALPPTVRAIAALDRIKEPGAAGEPLYQDGITALAEDGAHGDRRFERAPLLVGGRYGLASKELTPAMVKAVLDELESAAPRNHFTVGIVDDVSGTSLDFDDQLDIEPEDTLRAVFFGLGSDGTVGANKNSIRILGERPGTFAQGYFVYDSKKAGARTVSHLRFGPRPIRSTYLVRSAGFVACHQPRLLEGMDVLGCAAPGATFLLNSPHDPADVWDHLPREVQETIVEKRLRLFVVDAYRVAREAGLAGRINTVMQTCFFAITGALPLDEALAKIRASVAATYGKKRPELVKRNLDAVERALEHLHEVPTEGRPADGASRPPAVPAGAPDFVQRVTAALISGHGDALPVSAFPPDGTWPVGTARFEKRNLAREIPVWDAGLCIQCNKCALVCPHAAIRAKVYDPAALDRAPGSYKSAPYRGRDLEGLAYTIQVAPEDCTGCSLCTVVCPAKDKARPRHKAIDMEPQGPLVDAERENYRFFLDLPDPDRTRVRADAKGSQFFRPLFEASGACAGCGETPYVKLVTQLFGDRAIIANATGCSSIYGGNLPTTPYCTDANGRGPAWSNSLFEDNAEFGLGIRLAVDYKAERARALLYALAGRLDPELVRGLREASQEDEASIGAQRERVALLRARLRELDVPEAGELESLVEALVRRSVWLVGGDGWAYDIGFGGLDHVLASEHDVNILVLDTEVYSNTGGQQSKATPLAAAAKFASAGKTTPKKDLGMMAMSYGTAYVARVAFGARDAQTVRALREAESYPGPSLVIAYSHCIAHGYDLAQGAAQQKLAVDCGIWPLFRFDPRRAREGLPPLRLDSPAPRVPVERYMRNEARFRIVQRLDPKRFRRLASAAQRAETERFSVYEKLSKIVLRTAGAEGPESERIPAEDSPNGDGHTATSGRPRATETR